MGKEKDRRFFFERLDKLVRGLGSVFECIKFQIMVNFTSKINPIFS